MASGHVNRTDRPNTWLHRPSLQREDSPCQPGAVHTWPKADIPPMENSFVAVPVGERRMENANTTLDFAPVFRSLGTDLQCSD
jgi:hypothetical protein